MRYQHLSPDERAQIAELACRALERQHFDQTLRLAQLTAAAKSDDDEGVVAATEVIASIETALKATRAEHKRHKAEAGDKPKAERPAAKRRPKG